VSEHAGRDIDCFNELQSSRRRRQHGRRGSAGRGGENAGHHAQYSAGSGLTVVRQGNRCNFKNGLIASNQPNACGSDCIKPATKHHLIVSHEVTNIGDDRSQLSPMAEQARSALCGGGHFGGPARSRFVRRKDPRCRPAPAREQDGSNVPTISNADPIQSASGDLRPRGSQTHTWILHAYFDRWLATRSPIYFD
jgi:hypothetical protein